CARPRAGHRAPAGCGAAAWWVRENPRYRQKIESVSLDAMARAQVEVLIADAYFCPGRRIRAAPAGAARRGVKVRLLLQGQAEYAMQYRASRYMYDRLVDQGIVLYEYLPSYLHAKVAVIDEIGRAHV